MGFTNKPVAGDAYKETVLTDEQSEAFRRRDPDDQIASLSTRIEKLEAALRPLAKAHKSDRPYNEITLHDCRVAFDLLATVHDEQKPP